MSALLAAILPLWSALVTLFHSIAWGDLAGFLAATGGMCLISKAWVSRGLWGSKVPFLAAAFELLEVFGFSPSLLAAWVRRRSWYQRGQVEADRIRSTLPRSLVVLVVLSCSGAPLPEGLSCPIPDIRKATLPAAIALARSVLTLASSSCGDACPAELATARTAVDRTEATAKDVCSAISIARLVPCEQCADRLDAVVSLLACEASPP
jgi:hypothetical protein